MSNLDTKYIINLDLNYHVDNNLMYFSVSDYETCDFYINIIRDKNKINKELSSTIAKLYVLKPDKIVECMDIIYDDVEDTFYCNLPNNLKDMKGIYLCQVIFIDEVNDEKKVALSKFRYRIRHDLPNKRGD